MRSGTTKPVDGVTRPSWRAPATVMILLAGVAGELLLELELEPREALVVGAHHAEEGDGERTSGVEAFRLVEKRDAGERERLDGISGGVVDLARQVDEGAAGTETGTQQV